MGSQRVAARVNHLGNQLETYLSTVDGPHTDNELTFDVTLGNGVKQAGDALAQLLQKCQLRLVHAGIAVHNYSSQARLQQFPSFAPVPPRLSPALRSARDRTNIRSCVS